MVSSESDEGIKTRQCTVNDKSFTVRKLLRFSRIFIKPQKFSLLNFCSSESSDMYEGGAWWKNRETFPHIPDEPSKPRTFLVYGSCYIWLWLYNQQPQKHIILSFIGMHVPVRTTVYFQSCFTSLKNFLSNSSCTLLYCSIKVRVPSHSFYNPSLLYKILLISSWL